jgi:hypothetical protein
VVEPEYLVCATPALTLPDKVTVDCAKATPVAARAARAIRDFFIASFSKVKQGPESEGCFSPIETLSQPPNQEVACIPPDDCDFAKTFPE